MRARRFTVPVHGVVEPGFGRVADAFRDNFRVRGELGASFCAYHRGRCVVDVWSGLADRRDGRPWTRDTLAVLFSATKGLAAACLLTAADRGELDYDAPVAERWPGFAKEGKQSITVRTLLNHRAGLVALDAPIDLDDFELRPDRVRRALEAQAPLWEPGARQGYHGVTFGPYAAEVLRRATGQSIGERLAADLAGPLDAEVHIGLPVELEPRVARTYAIGARERLGRVVPKLLADRGRDGRVYRAAATRDSMTQRAFRHPRSLGLGGIANFDSRRVRRLELPWANGVGNARGLARVYAALSMGGALEGTRVCSPEAIAPLRERQSWSAVDEVLRKPMGFSQGFVKEQTELFSPNPASFGHPGAGGALGWCDPDAQLGIGYVMNQMTHHLRSPRALALCHALYRCVG